MQNSDALLLFVCDFLSGKIKLNNIKRKSNRNIFSKVNNTSMKKKKKKKKEKKKKEKPNKRFHHKTMYT